MKNYSTQTQTINRSFRMQTHRSSDSSNGSMASSIFSMCPLDMDTQLTNTSLLEQDDQQSRRSSADSISKKTNRKQLFQRGILRSTKRSRDDSDLISISSTQSCLSRLIVHPIIDEDPISIREILPPMQTIGIKLTSERISQLEQRQDGLDRTVKVLLDELKSRDNERIKEINKYWSYIQSNLLDKYQSKINPYQLFESLRNSSIFNSQYQTFLTLNPDITGMILVLTTILSMIHQETSIASIMKVFSQQEQILFDGLRDQLEYVLSSYTDELSFIRERCNYYRSNPTDENNYSWMQIIQTEYPNLIEKISNDYITKIPQIHSNLFQLLTNIKINLLRFHFS